MKALLNVFTQYKGLSKSIYVIFIANIVTTMGAFIWPLTTLILSKKIGYSATTIAMILIGIAVLYVPANIIGGKLADKYNKKKIIILFDGISIIAFMICSFLEPGLGMMVLLVIAGLFANMEGPALEALIVEASKPEEREKVFSLSYLGHNLGFIFGASIGGMLFANYLNLAFVIDGMTTLFSTILIILFVKVIQVENLKESEKNEYEEGEETTVSMLTVLLNRKSVFIQIFLFSIGAFIYEQWSFSIPLYLGELFGDGGAEVFGFISSFNGIVVIVFTPILTVLLKNVKEIPKIMLGLLLYSLSYLIIKDNPVKYVFYIMMFIFTLGEIAKALGGPSFMSRRIPATHRGRVNGLIRIGYMLGGMAGNLVAGISIDQLGYNVTFNIMAILGIVGAVGMAFNYKLDQRLFPKLYEEQAVIETDK